MYYAFSICILCTMHLVTLITALPKSATSAGDLELGQVINGTQGKMFGPTCDASNSFKCIQSEGMPCINRRLECDGKRDCDYGDHVCDGENDCPKGEDEADCSNFKCPSEKFTCSNSTSGRRCINETHVCDGDRDCKEGEDELNCPNTNCEIVLKLLQHNIPWKHIPDWICIIKASSKFNRRAKDTAGYGLYGLFQISGQFWCGEGKNCNMTCDDLKDDDISDDIECAKLIQSEQSFSAFMKWKDACDNKAEPRVYTQPCLPIPGQNEPKITIPSQKRNVTFINGTENQRLSCKATGFPIPMLEWNYDKAKFPLAFSKRREFKSTERPAKETKVELYFPSTENFKKQNKFECNGKNHVGTDKATFYVNIVEPKTMVPMLSSGVPYEVIIPVFLIATVGIVFFTILIHRKYFMRTGLTDAEIEEFLRGNPDRFKIGSSAHANPASQPYDNKYEIPPSSLQIYKNQVLGTGEFGVITKGQYENTAVAVKTVHPNADKAHFKALINEIKVMIHIGEHPGIVNLIGAQTADLRRGVVNIAVEFCELGDLCNFMRKNKELFTNSFDLHFCDDGLKNYENFNTFKTSNLLQWSIQIAVAMEYLESKNVIHGDLATRNVLLFSKERIKLTDFGLSKRLYDTTQYVKKRQVPLPWRWMAYESLTTLSYTTLSDTWSFGITLWEIFSLGDTPYPGLSWTLEFPVQLENGLRPLQPKYATPGLYALLLDCWNISPNQRPKWKKIHDILGIILSKPNKP